MKNTFSKSIIPKNEEARLRNSYSYQLLDTPFEDTFDDITNLVCN